MGVRDYSSTAASNLSVAGISIAEGWAPASVNNAYRAGMADIADLLKDLGGAKTTTGSGGAYLLSLDTAPTAYANNLFFLATSNHTNAGAATLNVDSVGVKAIEKLVFGSAEALTGGEFPVGHVGIFTYSSANNSFLLLNTATDAIGSSDVAQFGVVYDGVTDASAALLVAEASGQALVVSGEVFIDADVTMTAPITFTGNGSFNVDAGNTVTLSGPLDLAPRSAHFLGDGDYSFSDNLPPYSACDAMWFGCVADGDGTTGTDNAEALFRLNHFCAGNPGMKVGFPSGIMCTTEAAWMLNVKSVYLDFVGCTLQSIRSTGGYETFPLLLGSSLFIDREIGEIENDRPVPDFIDTVAAGATSVHFKVAGKAALHTVGSWSLICGYDTQGTGFPYNYRYFEYLRVIAVDGGANTITFERPLRYSYNEDWFSYLSSGDAIGPAGVLPLDRGDNFLLIEDAEVRNFRCLRNPFDVTPEDTHDGVSIYHSDRFIVAGCLDFKGYNIVCDTSFCGEGYSFLYEDCHLINFEPDKIAHSLVMRRGSVINANQATGFNHVELDRVRIRRRDSLTAPNVHVHDCHYTHATDTPLAMTSRYGQSRYMENCQFDYAALSTVFSGYTNVTDATRTDRPGPYSVEVLDVPGAGQFRVLYTGAGGDVNLTDGRFRIYVGAGTVMKRPSDGARFVVTDVTYTSAAPAKFIVSYTSQDAVVAGDFLYFHPMSRYIVHGCRRTIYSKLPWHSGFMPGETYINTSDTINDQLVDMVWQDFAGSMSTTFTIDGYLDEIDIIVRKIYSGAGDKRVRLTATSPFGSTFDASIDTGTLGRRTMTVSAATAALGTDSGIAALGNVYVRDLRLLVNAADNEGTIGCKGSFRIKATRRR